MERLIPPGARPSGSTESSGHPSVHPCGNVRLTSPSQTPPFDWFHEPAAAGGQVAQVGRVTAAPSALDASRLLVNPTAVRLGFGLTALAGLGLAWLPIALRARLPSRRNRWVAVDSAAYLVGVAAASLVDLLSIIDPDETGLGEAVGPPALILVSAGLLTMRRAAASSRVQRARLRRLLLLAGTWLLLQLPVNLAAFIAPAGVPSFVPSRRRDRCRHHRRHRRRPVPSWPMTRNRLTSRRRPEVGITSSPAPGEATAGRAESFPRR
jgi:hypothetical protein